MHPFIETVSVAGGVAVAVVATIMLLTLFYRGLSWLSGGPKHDEVLLRGVLTKETTVTVHVSGQKTFERVKFIGFTNSDSIKTHIPFELNGMIILEDEWKTRYLVRAKDVRKIVVPGDAATPPAGAESETDIVS